jgi:hypothetical protein
VSAHELAEHLATCRQVDAVIVGDDGVDMTPTVEQLLAAGWVLEGEETAAGKRVRCLRASDARQDGER